MFLTTFQCGMSPMWWWQMTRLESASSHQPAIFSATRWGGQIMMCKDLGEIREGWLADLLLVDGDPLANISILQDKSKLLAIMKDGQFAKPPEIRSSRSRFVA